MNLVKLLAAERLQAEIQDYERSVQDNDFSRGTAESKLPFGAFIKLVDCVLGAVRKSALEMRPLVRDYGKATRWQFCIGLGPAGYETKGLAVFNLIGPIVSMATTRLADVSELQQQQVRTGSL